ncbi:hypothetical protein P6P90_09465 [Ectobacillus antri]|jgi:hypothetical protein|uniref:Uncharacterized protein n=1 Tax=Ectobacillus antri TaxID=2486280 RepID=A0ABT6H6V6_9BACI|nr:hypothetical protein [Ectobacillus antri]MDG4656907.1 hypothetical protein [Ectobacillus antri]MDG5754196.1 hypothetical protein [Ectobacillus antri]
MMSNTVGLLLTILLQVGIFSLANFLAFKYSINDIKRRIVAGVLFLLCTPIVYVITFFFVLIYDNSGWGAGILTVIFSGLYMINGVIIVLSALHLYMKNLK